MQFLLGSNIFKRLSRTVLTPASILVELTATSSRIEAAAGNSTSADFLVINYGQSSDITVKVDDVLDFFTSVEPERYVLKRHLD